LVKYYLADQGLRQINEDDNTVKSSLALIGQTKEPHLRNLISDLQQGGTKKATYSEIIGGIFGARAYLDEIKSKANRRTLACFRIGSHVLRIESGRWSNKAQSSRV